MTKRILALLTGAAISLSLAACGGDAADDGTPSASTSSTQSAKPGAQKWDAGSSTMTLTNANLTVGILLTVEEATLVLVGDNTITLNEDDHLGTNAVSSLGKLNVTGDGSLTIKVTNNEGPAGGFIANDLVIAIDKDSEIKVEATAGGGDAQGIFASNDLDFQSGRLDVTASTQGADDLATAALAYKGRLAIGKDASVKADLKAPQGFAEAVGSVEGSATIDGTVDASLEGAGPVLGVGTLTGLTVGEDSDIKVRLVATKAEAYGIANNTGMVELRGTVDMVVESTQNAGGLFYKGDFTADGADFKAVVSTTRQEQSDPAAVDDPNNSKRPIFGIVTKGKSTIENSTFDLEVKSAGDVVYGIHAIDPLTIADSKVTIDVTAGSGPAYGIDAHYAPGSSGADTASLTLKSVTGSVTSSKDAIVSWNNIDMTGTAAANGLTVSKQSDHWVFLTPAGEPATKVELEVG